MPYLIPPRLDVPPVAWHGNPALKLQTVERMRKHRSLDQLIQGQYVRNPAFDPDRPASAGFRGCFLGCLVTDAVAKAKGETVESIVTFRNLPDWYGWAEYLYGISEPAAWVIEQVFEALPQEAAAAFAVEVLDAIPVGADLTHVADAVGARTDIGGFEDWEWEVLSRTDELDDDDAYRDALCDLADMLMEALRTAPVAELSP